MSKINSSLGQNELYFFHETERSSGSSTVKVFFTEFLDPVLLECDIRPSIMDRISNEESIESIVGYPHFIAVRLLHVDVVLGLITMKEQLDELRQILDTVLTNAFRWNASLIKYLADDGAVQRKGAEFHLDWSRGQTPF